MTRPAVLLLTATELPVADADTPLLATALRAAGVDAHIVPWDRVPADAPADLVLVRSTWDYAERPTQFVDALAALRRRARVHNPLPLLRWNIHKGYLVQLQAAGVPVVPVAVVPQGAAPRLPAVDSDTVVIKPAVGAGASGIGIFPAGSAAAIAHLGRLAALGEVLVQPFDESVRDGERSIVLIDGRYSHAVRKVPAAGDFRVQQEHGGRVDGHSASAAEIAAALAALAVARSSVDHDPDARDVLYARVDVVGPVDHPRVMELELIEPELFLAHGPGAAAALAAAIATRLA